MIGFFTSRGNFRKNLQLKGSVILDLKLFRLWVKEKHSIGRYIPESSCTKKGTVDIDILATSRNGDRKTMQSIRKTSRPTSRKRKWNQLHQF